MATYLPYLASSCFSVLCCALCFSGLPILLQSESCVVVAYGKRSNTTLGSHLRQSRELCGGLLPKPTWTSLGSGLLWLPCFLSCKESFSYVRYFQGHLNIKCSKSAYKYSGFPSGRKENLQYWYPCWSAVILALGSWSLASEMCTDFLMKKKPNHCECIS